MQDQALEAITRSCLTLSQRLLSKLNKLRIIGGEKHRRYKSFRQALKSVWAKRGVDGMAARLAALRREMNDHVMVSLRYDSGHSHPLVMPTCYEIC